MLIFYVFDGELPNRLLDPDSPDARAVVEYLFQVNELATMSQKVQDYWDQKTRHVTVKTEKGETQWENILDGLKERVGVLRAEQEELQKQHGCLEVKLREKEKAYLQEIKKEDARFKELRQAEIEVEALKG